MKVNKFIVFFILSTATSITCLSFNLSSLHGASNTVLLVTLALCRSWIENRVFVDYTLPSCSQDITRSTTLVVRVSIILRQLNFVGIS